MGKLSCIVARNCMVIKAIETACYLLKDVPGSSSTEINSAYYESCSQIVNNLDPNCFKIEKSVIEQAINLANYSAMTKMILSQYPVNPAIGLELSLEEIFKSEEENVEFSGAMLLETPKMAALMKTILLYPNESKPSVTTISNGVHR